MARAAVVFLLLLIGPSVNASELDPEDMYNKPGLRTSALAGMALGAAGAIMGDTNSAPEGGNIVLNAGLGAVAGLAANEILKHGAVKTYTEDVRATLSPTTKSPGVYPLSPKMTVEVIGAPHWTVVGQAARPSLLDYIKVTSRALNFNSHRDLLMTPGFIVVLVGNMLHEVASKNRFVMKALLSLKKENPDRVFWILGSEDLKKVDNPAYVEFFRLGELALKIGDMFFLGSPLLPENIRSPGPHRQYIDPPQIDEWIAGLAEWKTQVVNTLERDVNHNNGLPLKELGLAEKSIVSATLKQYEGMKIPIEVETWLTTQGISRMFVSGERWFDGDNAQTTPVILRSTYLAMVAPSLHFAPNVLVLADTPKTWIYQRSSNFNAVLHVDQTKDTVWDLPIGRHMTCVFSNNNHLIVQKVVHQKDSDGKKVVSVEGLKTAMDGTKTSCTNVAEDQFPGMLRTLKGVSWNTQ